MSLWQTGWITPRVPWADVFRHTYREFNPLADEAAKLALAQRKDFYIQEPAYEKLRIAPPTYMRIFTDGSHKDGLAASGCVVFCAWDSDALTPDDIPSQWTDTCGTLTGMAQPCNLALPRWEIVLRSGCFLGTSTIVNAELHGVETATKLLQTL